LQKAKQKRIELKVKKNHEDEVLSGLIPKYEEVAREFGFSQPEKDNKRK